MGKVKPKRKSTLIDMTAMSDVTVLLLTFFMLTSTFLQKEPVTVITPASVSQEKVPTSNVVTVLVGTEELNGKEEGKVFLSIAGDVDTIVGGSEKVRMNALRNAAKKYKELTNKDAGITDIDIEKFSKLNVFGVPMAAMHEFLQLSPEKQDEYMSELSNPNSGIPLTPIGPKTDQTNEFRMWMMAIMDAGNENLKDAMKSGEGIAIKADGTTNYETMHEVLDNLQSNHMNRFSVMTALKSESE